MDKDDNKTANPQTTIHVNVGGAPFSRHGMPFPRQSVKIHLILAITTMGIGNIIYYSYVKSRQRRWLRRNF